MRPDKVRSGMQRFDQACSQADLPRIGGRPTGALRYPLELVRAVAVVWVYAGLRADEIVRLRVGCIRWQREDVTPAGTDAVLPRDAVCFLSVPVNKTSGAFVKPVNTLVGKRIAEWEQVRAASQPPQRDPKSGGSVAYLFAHRGQRLGLRYLNASVIPTLCRKAGIPQADERGAITSHRARATIATLLYNAPEGLTIWELMEWLGHKDPKSTQHYARVKPTRLASAYTHADRTSHLVEVLVDTKPVATSELPVYYVLGDHGLCSNSAWATCEYRMACIKCPFFVPREPAQLIRSRQTVKHFLEIVQLSDHELAAVQDDEQKLAANIQRTQNLRPPQMLRRRAKGAAEPGIPLKARPPPPPPSALRPARVDSSIPSNSGALQESRCTTGGRTWTHHQPPGSHDHRQAAVQRQGANDALRAPGLAWSPLTPLDAVLRQDLADDADQGLRPMQPTSLATSARSKF
jgi:integrase-like protein